MVSLIQASNATPGLSQFLAQATVSELVVMESIILTQMKIVIQVQAIMEPSHAHPIADFVVTEISNFSLVSNVTNLIQLIVS